MPDEPPASGRPAPVVLRVKLRYATVEQFVDRFAVNVGRSGIFLASKTPRAVGTEVRFELRLADDTAVVVGVGTVRAARVEQAGPPKVPGGLLVAFTRVTPDSRAVLRRMLELRRARGFVDDAAGLPRLDAEPDATNAGPARASTSGGIDASDEAAAPVADDSTAVAVPPRRAASPTGRQAPRRSRARTSEPPPLDDGRAARRTRTRPPTLQPRTTTGPIAVVEPPRAAAPASAAAAGSSPAQRLLATADGPGGDLIAAAPGAAPARRARPRRSIDELVASAQAAAVIIADDFAGADVDVSAAVARARALTAGDVDAALRRLDADGAATVAAAVEPTDDVSQRLARVIGGPAVARRTRIAGRARRDSAPPPVVVEPPPPVVVEPPPPPVVVEPPPPPVVVEPPPPPPPVVRTLAPIEVEPPPPPPPVVAEPFEVISTVVTSVPPAPAVHVSAPVALPDASLDDDIPSSTDVTSDLELSADVTAPLPADVVTQPIPRTVTLPPAVPAPPPPAAIPSDLPPSPFLGASPPSPPEDDDVTLDPLALPPPIELPADLLATLQPPPAFEPPHRYERAQTSVSDDIGIDIAFEAAFDPSLPSRRQADAGEVEVEVDLDDLDRPRRAADIPLPPLTDVVPPAVADVLLASDEDFYISAAALTGAEPPETGLQVVPGATMRDVVPDAFNTTDEETSTGVVPVPAPGQALGRIKLTRGKRPTPSLRRTPPRDDRGSRPPRAMTPPPGLDDALESLDVEINTIEEPVPVPRRPLAAVPPPLELDTTDDVPVDLDDLES